MENDYSQERPSQSKHNSSTLIARRGNSNLGHHKSAHRKDIIQYRPANWTMATQNTPDVSKNKTTQRIDLRQTYDTMPSRKAQSHFRNRAHSNNDPHFLSHPSRTQYVQVMVDNRQFNISEAGPEAQSVKNL